MSRFSIDAVFKAIDKVTAPVKKMQSSVGRFTRSTERGFRRLNRVTDTFANGIRKATRTVAVGLGILSLASGSVLAAGADFEQAIVNVGAVSLQTRDQIQVLEKQALQLGATTKFTATQAAGAMEILAKAGFTNQQILKATPAILSAAAASGLEIAETADHVSNALKGMGLDVSKAAHVADVLALASSRTNSSIGSLGESLRNVASTARQLNLPFEDVVASVALLQDVGLDASVAGSAFNVMLTKMAAPSATLTKRMQKMGVSFKDAKGDMLPLANVLEQLNQAAKSAGGNFDQVAFLAELVGLRGQKAAANLANLFEKGKVADLTRELKNANGAAQQMATLRMGTVRGSFLLLNSAIDAVKVKLFDMNRGPLKETIDKMTLWVTDNGPRIANEINGALSKVVSNFEQITVWAKRVGVAFLVFVTFTTVLKTLIGVMTLVNLVMAANPVTLIVLGVLALVAAFSALVVWIDDVVSAFDKMPVAVKIILGPLGLLIKAIKFIKDNVGVLGTVASKVGSFLGFTSAEPGVGPAAARNSELGQGVVSPQERVATLLKENRSTETSEITLKTENGTSAEVTKGNLGTGLTLEPSGAF